MKSSLYHLIITQLKEFIREPGALFWSFAFPILMAWGLGIAFSEKKEVVRSVAVVNCESNDSSILRNFITSNTQKMPDKKDGIHRYEKTIKNNKLGNTNYHFLCTDWNNALLLLKRGNINVILKEDKTGVQYHFDPVNPEAQLIYKELPELFKNPNYVPETASIQALTMKGTRYVDFLVPGLITMGIMMSCMWGISYTMIEKRSKKLLRRMIATPIKKSNILIAQMVSRFIITSTESLALVIFTFFYFNLTIQGSITALIALFIAGNIAFMGIAILVASHTSNTQMGNGLINIVVTPMMMLSGIFFSYHNFPDFAVSIIQKLPLTIFTDSVRSVINEGAGFMNVWVSLLILTLTGLITFIVGLRIYKWY